jgi:activator of HSP90 ATPase
MTAPILQRVQFDAPPHDVFEALAHGDRFAAATGAPARSGPVPGSDFALFGGAIVGRQIEVVPDERLVQAWRVASWPAGVYSLARFEIRRTDAGSELEFSHLGFPAEEREHLDAGWHRMYWSPLQAFLAAAS